MKEQIEQRINELVKENLVAAHKILANKAAIEELKRLLTQEENVTDGNR